MSPSRKQKPTSSGPSGRQPANAPSAQSARSAAARKPKPPAPAETTTATSKPGRANVAAAPARAARPIRSGPPPAFEAIGVAKHYGELVALAPLELGIEPGEAVVLIGHNGSGKTTLLRMASGLLEPSEGGIEIQGQPAGTLAARAALAYLSDTPSFYDDLSVWEHLEYTARLHGMDDWEQRAADLLGHLGLYDRADDLPNTFSRGLRQKASIAIGLLRPHSVLLVDEPFVGLDATGKAALLELLDIEREEGVALVVATHELEFVKRVGRCIALRDGQLVHDGPTDGIDVLGLVT